MFIREEWIDPTLLYLKDPKIDKNLITLHRIVTVTSLKFHNTKYNYRMVLWHFQDKKPNKKHFFEGTPEEQEQLIDVTSLWMCLIPTKLFHSIFFNLGLSLIIPTAFVSNCREFNIET